jgi:hypothetical protein
MKKIAIVLVIALLVTAIFAQLGNLTTKAEGWTAKIGYDGPDDYSFCYHTHNGYIDDRCVGMGIRAYYDSGTPYDYVSTYWIFNSNVGANYETYWNFYPSDSYNTQTCDCWWNTRSDGIWHAYSFDGDSSPYWENGEWTMRERYPDYGTFPLYSHAGIICGKITQLFYIDHYPYPIVTYLSIQVQPFDRVSACGPPPTEYNGTITP